MANPAMPSLTELRGGKQTLVEPGERTNLTNWRVSQDSRLETVNLAVRSSYTKISGYRIATVAVAGLSRSPTAIATEAAPDGN